MADEFIDFFPFDRPGRPDIPDLRAGVVYHLGDALDEVWTTSGGLVDHTRSKDWAALEDPLAGQVIFELDRAPHRPCQSRR